MIHRSKYAAHLSHFIPRQVDRQLQISDLVVIVTSVLVAPGGRPHRPLLPDIVVVVAAAAVVVVVVVVVDSGLQQPLVQACVRVIWNCNYIISNLHNVQFTNNPLKVSGAVTLDTVVTFTSSRHAAADSGLIQTEVVNLYRHLVTPDSELSQATHPLFPPSQVSQCISRTANMSQMSLFSLFPRLSPRLIEQPLSIQIEWVLS